MIKKVVILTLAVASVIAAIAFFIESNKSSPFWLVDSNNEISKWSVQITHAGKTLDYTETAQDYVRDVADELVKYRYRQYWGFKIASGLLLVNAVLLLYAGFRNQPKLSD